jgi:capsular exopolysaccharide synthesis family protein
MDFLRLFKLFLRYKWLLLLLVAAASSATWFGVRLKGAAFQASATLLPQQQALQSLDGVASLSNSLADQELKREPLQARRARLDSLVALISSPRVLALVIAKLSLPATPSDLQRLIQVEPLTQELIRIKVTASSPELAADLVNGVASTFVQFYGDLSTNALAESTKLLHEQEQQARQELEIAKAAVQRYRASRHITSLNEQLNGFLARANALRQAREGTKAQLAELAAQLRQLDAQWAAMPAVSRFVEKSNDSPALQQLRARVASLTQELALERATRTENHPRVQELAAQLASTSALLKREQSQLLERVRYAPNPERALLQQRRGELKVAHGGLLAKVEALTKSLASLEEEMAAYSGADVQLATLMQRYSFAEQRYSGLLTRLRQAEANADTLRRSSAIAIVDTAGPTNPPVDVSLGTAKKLTIAAGALSLSLGLLVLAGWGYLDRAVRTSADAEALVELPVAAILPRALPGGRGGSEGGLAALQPVSPEGEAYRFLGLQLLLLQRSRPLQVIMLATAKPGEGATTTLANLAVTLAQGRRRVILVDADLRRPCQHALFGLKNEVGLTSVLRGEVRVEEALQETRVANLRCLTGGPLVEQPWELLRSGRLERLVEELRQDAEFVLIDTPSAAAFADGYHVAPVVDGVFMVVRARHQPTGVELKIKRMMEEAGGHVLGAVLNDVPIGQVESCRYHAQYYGGGKRGEQARAALPEKAGR